MLGPFATASRSTPHYLAPGGRYCRFACRLRIDVHDDDDSDDDNDNA